VDKDIGIKFVLVQDIINTETYNLRQSEPYFFGNKNTKTFFLFMEAILKHRFRRQLLVNILNPYHSLNTVIDKGKLHPRTGHEGPDGE
jgi:hypothetical protein